LRSSVTAQRDEASETAAGFMIDEYTSVDPQEDSQKGAGITYLI
jgi:hypothetical protein